jgi:phosphomannomutase
MYNTVVDIRKNQNVQISAIPVPVGRSILRRLIRDGTIDMGVENVGHFYMKDFFMTDSGAFSLVVILYWMSIYGSLSSLPEKHPDGLRTQFALPHSENKKIDIDGIRCEIFRGEYLQTWYAARPSGYEKIEKYYFGSLDEKDYKLLQEKIRKG